MENLVTFFGNVITMTS